MAHTGWSLSMCHGSMSSMTTTMVWMVWTWLTSFGPTTHVVDFLHQRPDFPCLKRPKARKIVDLTQHSLLQLPPQHKFAREPPHEATTSPGRRDLSLRRSCACVPRRLPLFNKGSKTRHEFRKPCLTSGNLVKPGSVFHPFSSCVFFSVRLAFILTGSPLTGSFFP